MLLAVLAPLRLIRCFVVANLSSRVTTLPNAYMPMHGKLAHHFTNLSKN